MLHKRIQSTLHLSSRHTISLVVVFCVHVHEERRKKQHIMRICGFDKEKGFLTNFSTGQSPHGLRNFIPIAKI